VVLRHNGRLPSAGEAIEVTQMSVNTLSEMLQHSASRWPARVAVADAAGGPPLTYRELDAVVADLTLQLVRQGAGKGDTVAIVSDNCLEYVLALFAVLGLGAAAAPLNPALTAPEVVSTLRRLRARAAIVPAHLHDDFVTTNGAVPSAVWKLALVPGQDRRLQAELTTSQTEPAGSIRAERPEADPPGADVALLLLTSGTTAEPKVVPLTNGNLLASIEGIRTVYRLSPDDATLLVMPLSHGHGLVAGLLATLASGGAAYLPTGGRFHASTFWSDMVTAQATWYTAVPTIHQILLARAGKDYPKDGHPHLRFVRSCSAPLAPEVLQAITTAFSAPVLQAYGTTETAHQISSNPLPSDGPDKAASVGLGTGVEIQVRASGGRPVATGKAGEVWVRGPAVTSGYLDNKKATAEGFTDGWFHTGDLGHQDADGYLFLTGRIKDLIDRGGEKISPTAVDEVLQSSPGVEDALAFGLPDEEYGEEVAAAVVLRSGQVADEDALKRYVGSKLSAVEVPKRIFFVSDLPRTAKGAGDRRRLAAQFSPRK
jgi:acyl-CoA synthetase (AMP-forming)/AMP-acid ligase II